MAIEKLESWHKWLLGIVTVMICTGIPTTVGYVVGIRESIEKVDAKITMINYRVDQLEQADKAITARSTTIGEELVRQSKEIFLLTAKIDHTYASRTR